MGTNHFKLGQRPLCSQGGIGFGLFVLARLSYVRGRDLVRGPGPLRRVRGRQFLLFSFDTCRNDSLFAVIVTEVIPLQAAPYLI